MTVTQNIFQNIIISKFTSKLQLWWMNENNQRSYCMLFRKKREFMWAWVADKTANQSKAYILEKQKRGARHVQKQSILFPQWHKGLYKDWKMYLTHSWLNLCSTTCCATYVLTPEKKKIIKKKFFFPLYYTVPPNFKFCQSNKHLLGIFWGDAIHIRKNSSTVWFYQIIKKTSEREPVRLYSRTPCVVVCTSQQSV